MMHAEQLFLACLMGLMSVFGVAANIAALTGLCLSAVKRKRFSKPVLLFLMLSITDMVFAGAVSAPTTLALFIGKDVLGPYCNFHTVLARWLLYFQAVLLVTIGIDRAYLSVRPLLYRKYGSLKDFLALVALGLVLTGLISIPKLYLQRFVYNQGLGQCVLYGYHDSKSGFSMILNAADKIIGMGGMLCLIGCNLVLIFSNRGRSLRAGSKSSRKPAQKLTVIAVIVMLVFVISVLPYLVIKMLFNIKKSLFVPPFHPWMKRAIVSSYFLMHISSSVNPVLYVLQGFAPKKLVDVKLSLNILESGQKSVASAGQLRRSTLGFKTSVCSITNYPEGAGSRDRLYIVRKEGVGESVERSAEVTNSICHIE
ncbi:somatostatin receptor type 5-like [Bolinopsis microptera]|uniref:somatostatin receptor type 5-like n=1 Tax=Bolinopsis microptera TaxID=2820187 RepID=UPI0030793013